MRGGNQNMPILPDISIEWILQTYVSHLKPKGETLHLIPISMTYERLFELMLTLEMSIGRYALRFSSMESASTILI